MPASMTLLVRADCGPRTGLGHIMRMFALADAWRSGGGNAVMLCDHLPGTLRRRITDRGIAVRTTGRRKRLSPDQPGDQQADAAATLSIARQIGADWIAADGYVFGDLWQQVIADSDIHLLMVDDYGHATHRHSDLVVNQNIYATDEDYAELSPSQILAGCRYLMMRSEFSGAEIRARTANEEVRRALITFGGADSNNDSLTVLKILAQTLPEPFQIDLILGSAYSHRKSLDEYLRDCPLNVQIHVDTTKMSRIMQVADLAVTAGGSTCYELARCGVPAVAVSVAENQVPVAGALHKAGALFYFGDNSRLKGVEFKDRLLELIGNLQQRNHMIAAGQKLIDGRGTKRIVTRMMSEQISLRPASAEDGRVLLNWRNDPETRAVSFSNGVISLDQHLQWLKGRLTDPDCRIWIAEDRDGTAVGQVRVQKSEDSSSAFVSIGLQSGFRGRGLGTVLIERACRMAVSELEVHEVVAQIKPHNAASRAAFAKAGFLPSSPTVIHDQAAIQMIWKLDRNAAGGKPLRKTA